MNIHITLHSHINVVAPKMLYVTYKRCMGGKYCIRVKFFTVFGSFMQKIEKEKTFVLALFLRYD